MRIPIRALVGACALAVASLAVGCAGSGIKPTARTGEQVFLQPAADQGPEPFTASTATAVSAPATARVPAVVPSGPAVLPLHAARTLSGATPGLYRGTPHVAGCDVERHIGYLAADEAKAEAFAHAADVGRAALPGYLRGLTPVALRADTRVTSHAYRDRRAAGFQAVLQAGTAVLVDDRGVPRMRCACGNPLSPPAPSYGGAGTRGTAWPGYRPNQVIVVTPAPRAVTSITIVETETMTWIERRTGHDVRRDRVVPAAGRATTSPPDADPAGTTPASTRPPAPRESRTPLSPGRTGRPPSPAGPLTPDGGTDYPESATSLADRHPTNEAGEPPYTDPFLSPSPDPFDATGLPDTLGLPDVPGLPDDGGLPDVPGPPDGDGVPDALGRPDGGGPQGALGLSDGGGPPDALGLPDGDGVPDALGLSDGGGPPDALGLPDGGGPVPADPPDAHASTASGTPATPGSGPGGPAGRAGG
ncbi:DUF6777 domain-containing protein [Streptomyces sp. NPDC013455]|uniref:DUF6777 domain-containing protein n=1 Tax=Streptomyces sp. NPDC013455 TaxID=3155605 RepID=UPI0033C64611